MNSQRLIAGQPIRVYKANGTRVHKTIAEADNWTLGAREGGDFPAVRYLKTSDILGAAIGYYLHMCLPAAPAVTPDGNKRAVYLYLCWIVMEVTNLVSMYTRGPSNQRADQQLQARPPPPLQHPVA